MLEKLFSSKARIAVLKLFLFNPDDSYYLREISSLASIPIRAVQREVKKLKEIGLLEESVSGNRVYYRANRKSPIFEDLKRIFFKTEGIVKVLEESFQDKTNIDVAVEKLKKTLKEKLGKEIELFLFGSVARGENAEPSDVDILVLLKNSVVTSIEEEIFDIAYEIGLEYNIVFGIIVYTKKRWNKLSNLQSPLVIEIEKEGVKI